MITNGWWDVQPGAWNIVPGLVHFSVDLRHPDEVTKQRLAAQVRHTGEQIAAERGVGIAYEVVGDVPPKDMDVAVKNELQAAADAAGVKWIPMVSGARLSVLLRPHVALLLTTNVEVASSIAGAVP